MDKNSSGYKLSIQYFSINILYNLWYFFPLTKTKIITKDMESPWITKGIKKSSKRKQHTYSKFLNERN